MNSVDFIHLFSEFFIKILPILIKFNKIFQENVFFYVYRQIILSAIFNEFFCHKFRLIISQKSDFIKKSTK